MQPLNKHIVIIGFKHTGKSTIGKNLAKKLGMPFIDLDNIIELQYENTFHKKNTCRQIMQQHGENFFRSLETDALLQVITQQTSVISLGGGTPMFAENQQIINACIRIHLTAPQEIVFQRIITNGRPAFFTFEENMQESLTSLWDERIEIYEKIKSFSIDNNGSVENTVNKIINELEKN